MPNTNCLEDMRCPKCGLEEPFLIAVTGLEQVSDDGADRSYDTEWDDGSACICTEADCGYEATVAMFRVGAYQKKALALLRELAQGGYTLPEMDEIMPDSLARLIKRAEELTA